MSHQPSHNQTRRVTVPDILAQKSTGPGAGSGAKKISAVTCYDSAFARLLNATDVDFVLVGDSLGNVILGYESTIPVTLDHMIHHGAAVGRSLKRALLCVDMPFMSYQASTEQALLNAARVMRETGAHSVKLEGGMEIIPQIEKLTQAGIPVVGHIGLTPQKLASFGTYKVQGRQAAAAKRLEEEALAMAKAGVFALVLEMVPASLAAKISASIAVPTIGIGAGAGCDGQILVLHDLLGFDDGFSPKFLKKYATLGGSIVAAVQTYSDDVRQGTFPAAEHSFND